MRKIGCASEDEMILAWVRGDYCSKQCWGEIMRRVLGNEVRYIDHRARTDDDAQNLDRKHALTCARGYGIGKGLFSRFPSHLHWIRLALSNDELGGLLYLDHKDWRVLSEESLLVRDGAQNVDRVEVQHGVNDKIRGIAQALQNGQTCPKIPGIEREFQNGRTYSEPIIVAEDRDAPHTILEGHGRATAYHRVLSRDSEFEVIAGYSPDLTPWLEQSWK